MRNAKAWSGIAALALLGAHTQASAQSDHELAYIQKTAAGKPVEAAWK